MNLREMERESIHRFVTQAASEGYLSGRVLDFGCGKQPYRDIVEAAGGEYVGHDRISYPANVSGVNVGTDDEEWDDWDAVLCTQVVQYVGFGGNGWSVQDMLGWFHHITRGLNTREHHGHLVLTYPTNWPEVEPEDLHRFTKAGMERLLVDAGFTVVMHQRRASVWAERLSSEEFALGYGVVCRA
jgi:hypothetical protein